MMKQPDIRIILASASPRRRDMLQEAGLHFDIIPAHIDESFIKGETPLEHVRRLAAEKGDTLAKRFPQALILSADTIVVYHGRILGKPRNREEAFSMLKSLSDKDHEVITAFALISEVRNVRIVRHEQTTVHFHQLSDADIHAYIASGSPMDKAGAYGIQDMDFNPVKDIKGCFYNVVGFPLPAFMKVWNELFPQPEE